MPNISIHAATGIVRKSRWIQANRLLLGLIVGLLFLRGDYPSRGQDAEQPAEQGPLGQFVTITSPVDASVFGKVSRAATALQNRAQQERRKAVLVLEISEGASRFGDVRELASFLSTELPSITTVAWVPKEVRGYNVILALACNEIIMRPKASLGDIGRGKAVEPDAQSFVVNMVNRRHNSRLSEALALGMMEPQKEVIWVRLKIGTPPNVVHETRVVSPAEFERLIKGKAVVEEQQTIKAAGTDGMFSGSQARALNIVVTQTAETRSDVATIYKLQREALREDPAAGTVPKARRIRVEGMVSPLMSEFLQRQIQRSINAGANLLVFEIESGGGYLHSGVNLARAISDLDPKQVRTVAFIPKEALSSAAIIALGCDEIYMERTAKFGDAGPLEVKEGGAFHRAEEKVLSLEREILKELAEKKKRPPALAMAMADKDLVVYKVTNSQTGDIWYMSEPEIHASNGEWIKGEAVPESAPNLLLTVNGVRGHELKLTEPPVNDFEELKQRLGIPALEPMTAVVATLWISLREK